jgi:hypothetical protein
LNNLEAALARSGRRWFWANVLMHWAAVGRGGGLLGRSVGRPRRLRFHIREHAIESESERQIQLCGLYQRAGAAKALHDYKVAVGSVIDCLGRTISSVYATMPA